LSVALAGHGLSAADKRGLVRELDRAPAFEALRGDVARRARSSS